MGMGENEQLRQRRQQQTGGQSVPPFVVSHRDVRLFQLIGEDLHLAYQLFVPWQEFEQVRVVGFQPGVVAMFTTPLLCVAVFTVVEL